MSCFFCNSQHHVTINCDIHESDESRQHIAATKGHCPNCLVTLNAHHSTKTTCKSTLKCYICFGKGHHTVFCPKRFTAPCITLPNIDSNILSRFLKVLKFEEKYFLTLSNPNIFYLEQKTPLNIRYRKQTVLPNKRIPTAVVDVIVADSMFINKYHHGPSPNDLGIPASIIFRVRHLDINITKFSSRELLQLLSSETKILRCGDIRFYHILEFQDIIRKAPKLECIKFASTNMVINKSWPTDLLLCNSATSLQYLSLHITDVYFNIKSLVNLLRKNSAKDLKIFLHIRVQPHERQPYENLNTLLLKYFTSEKFPMGQSLQISLFQCASDRVFEYEEYVLKNV